MNEIRHRLPQEVLDDHLRESQDGSVEDDLARNYSEDRVVLTGRGAYRSHNGLKQLAELLRNELPDGTFDYRTRLVEGEMGVLEWTGYLPVAQVNHGADSHLLRDGRIVAQTIHYTARPLLQPRGGNVGDGLSGIQPTTSEA